MQGVKYEIFEKIEFWGGGFQVIPPLGDLRYCYGIGPFECAGGRPCEAYFGVESAGGDFCWDFRFFMLTQGSGLVILPSYELVVKKRKLLLGR